MAGRPTLWGAGQIVKAMFSRSAEPPPNFYVALIRTIAPNPYMSGAEIDEPSADDGYQRVEVPNDLSMWVEGSSASVMQVNDDVLFLPASNDWGSIGWWALCDSDVEGNVYAIGDFTNPQIIDTGDQLKIGADTLVIEMGPFAIDEGNS